MVSLDVFIIFFGVALTEAMIKSGCAIPFVWGVFPITRQPFALIIAPNTAENKRLVNQIKVPHYLELVSKELNHLAAILHVYAGGLNFMK